MNQIIKVTLSNEILKKIGLRGPMPPGMLFAVYDSVTGVPKYIPPEYCNIRGLDELVEYVNIV